uniref:Uncharacterized protein n=1 Tax=Anopheles farauti TaxID=69004 RepID=A0A182QCU3_9DIPT
MCCKTLQKARSHVLQQEISSSARTVPGRTTLQDPYREHKIVDHFLNDSRARSVHNPLSTINTINTIIGPSARNSSHNPSIENGLRTDLCFCAWFTISIMPRVTSGTSPSTVGHPLYWNCVTWIVSFVLQLVTVNSRFV